MVVYEETIRLLKSQLTYRAVCYISLNAGSALLTCNVLQITFTLQTKFVNTFKLKHTFIYHIMPITQY